MAGTLRMRKQMYFGRRGIVLSQAVDIICHVTYIMCKPSSFLHLCSAVLVLLLRCEYPTTYSRANDDNGCCVSRRTEMVAE